MNISALIRHHLLPMLLFVILFTGILFIGSSSRAGASLSTLSDLPRIEKDCIAVADNANETKSVKKELILIRKSLKAAPAHDRSLVLRRLCNKTKWGTPERMVAYYVSAWYGVNYTRCRDYLFNYAFHNYTSFEKPEHYDLMWEAKFDLLYQLYEHNHDFKLLHDLFIAHTGEHMGEMLWDMRVDAITNHPRGVLHVAAISNEGQKTLIEELIDSYEIDPSASYKEINYRELFLIYCRRVAEDSNDPLREIAKRILRGTKGSVKPLKVHKY
ncbi:MAG: hypothetical protein ACYC0V_12600 [Armatimonadota bacterium]